MSLCPLMSLRKGAKIIAIVDGVWSIIMIGLIAMAAVELFEYLDSEEAQLRIPADHGFAMVFGLAVLGVVFVAKLLAAIPLYRAANRNIDSRSIWIWHIIAACSITVFGLDTLSDIRDSNNTGAALFLTFTVYKVYSVFVVIDFHSSVSGEEAGVSYSATGGKHGNTSVQVVSTFGEYYYES